MTGAGRDQLLRAAVEHFAEHGVSDRSLRGIAAAVGTSHRMLIYHFGSREGLLAEVVRTVEDDHRATLVALAAAPGADPRSTALRFWSQVATAARRYGPLFFELSAHAMQRRPHADRLRAALVEPWLVALADLVAEREPDPERARTLARLGLGVARGLLHDALVTGDFAAADAAMAAFVELTFGPPGGAAGDDRDPIGVARPAGPLEGA